VNLLRYLGKQDRIVALYEALIERDGAAHPIELSKDTGLDMFEVQRRLEGCPELFVKLPRRDDLVRWRLTSATAAMEPEAVAALIRNRARSEQLQVTAAMTILASIGLLVLATVVPASSMGLFG
jgi:hypothetical protein